MEAPVKLQVRAACEALRALLTDGLNKSSPEGPSGTCCGFARERGAIRYFGSVILSQLPEGTERARTRPEAAVEQCVMPE